MQSIQTAATAAERTAPCQRHAVEVLLNFKPVTLPDDDTTGLGIKQAAIEQGVGIQLDFVLFEEHGHGHRELIRDDQLVHVHRGACFEAIPGDDNS